MIILDTNVISALTTEIPDRKVIDWLDGVPVDTVFTTAVTVFELMVGIERLEHGRRRTEYLRRTETVLDVLLSGRILSITDDVARAAAKLNGQRKTRGITVDPRDTLIAGACIVTAATLVTRNVRDFADAGFPIINPWAD